MLALWHESDDWPSLWVRMRQPRLLASDCRMERSSPLIGLVPLEQHRWRVTIRDTSHPMIPTTLSNSLDFQNSDREHRRILLALASSRFATMSAPDQDATLARIAEGAPEPKGPRGSLVMLLPDAGTYISATDVHVVTITRELPLADVVRAAHMAHAAAQEFRAVDSRTAGVEVINCGAVKARSSWLIALLVFTTVATVLPWALFWLFRWIIAGFRGESRH
jgi:hypothetical protein